MQTLELLDWKMSELWAYAQSCTSMCVVIVKIKYHANFRIQLILCKIARVFFGLKFEPPAFKIGHKTIGFQPKSICFETFAVFLFVEPRSFLDAPTCAQESMGFIV